MTDKDIKTTVVGSYPVPQWLAAYPSESGLRDAVLAVLKIQELAGLDVLSDGEISRFDINHPETNGMIDYFIGPMGGVGTQLTQRELADYRGGLEMGFRSKPAGVVRDKLNAGTLDLDCFANHL